MSNECSIIVDCDRKYSLVKYLSLENVLEKEPCAEALVDFIKAFPKEMLLVEIDPEDTFTTHACNNFKRLIKTLTANDKWWEVVDFLESSGFIECEDLTDEEWDRYWKNKRRREARAKAKKKNNKK